MDSETGKDVSNKYLHRIKDARKYARDIVQNADNVYCTIYPVEHLRVSGIDIIYKEIYLIPRIYKNSGQFNGQPVLIHREFEKSTNVGCHLCSFDGCHSEMHFDTYKNKTRKPTKEEMNGEIKYLLDIYESQYYNKYEKTKLYSKLNWDDFSLEKYLIY